MHPHHFSCFPPPDDEDVGLEVQSEDSEDELEREVGLGTGDGMDEEGDELGNPESEESEGEEDVIVAKGKNSTKTYGLTGRRGMAHCSLIAGVPVWLSQHLGECNILYCRN